MILILQNHKPYILFLIMYNQIMIILTFDNESIDLDKEVFPTTYLKVKERREVSEIINK